MYWRHKAKALRFLSQVPSGKKMYLAVQKLLGTTRPQPERDITRAIELIEMIRESGQSVENSRVYEIGTGWNPTTPLVFYLAGAREIETVDVNPWLSLQQARSAVRTTKPKLDWLIETLDLDPEETKKRFNAIKLMSLSLVDFLESMNTVYRFPGDASSTPHPDHSFDYVISSNVLEHIPYDILKAISVENFRILQPGGLAVHRFNPGDHYANDDENLTTGNFLKFTDDEWQKYGDGLAYHNRLRCSQFSKLFRECGYLLLTEKTRVDPVVLEELQQGRLIPAPQFESFSQEDLASDYMWLVGMKGNLSATQDASDSQKAIPTPSPHHQI